MRFGALGITEGQMVALLVFASIGAFGAFDSHVPVAHLAFVLRSDCLPPSGAGEWYLARVPWLNVEVPRCAPWCAERLARRVLRCSGARSWSWRRLLLASSPASLRTYTLPFASTALQLRACTGCWRSCVTFRSSLRPHIFSQEHGMEALSARALTSHGRCAPCFLSAQRLCFVGVGSKLVTASTSPFARFCGYEGRASAAFAFSPPQGALVASLWLRRGSSLIIRRPCCWFWAPCLRTSWCAAPSARAVVSPARERCARARVQGRLIISNVTGSPFPALYPVYWPFAFVVANSYSRLLFGCALRSSCGCAACVICVSRRRPVLCEILVARAYLATVVAAHAHFVWCVVDEISSFLGIRVFLLPAKRE